MWVLDHFQRGALFLFRHVHSKEHGTKQTSIHGRRVEDQRILLDGYMMMWNSTWLYPM